MRKGLPLEFFGAQAQRNPRCRNERDRTSGLAVPNGALYQLSYISMIGTDDRIRTCK
jgi:hypothetical protein